jgi:hypothetical protein
MEAPMLPALAPVVKRVAIFVAAAAIAAGGIGYAVHERHSAQAAQAQAAQNAQTLAQLVAKNSQLEALVANANAPVPDAQATTPAPSAAPAVAKPSAASGSRQTAAGRSSTAHNARDPRYDKLQLLLDSQSQRIDAHDKAIESTRTDLENARTELSGSIAMTHDELVLLEKKGERNYYEFDLTKSKQFNRAGPVSISLRKANTKHAYADLALLVNDRDMSQKNVNLYQPAMFYQPDSHQPIEIVINEISKNHIHGYVSAPKYRGSELSAMSSSSQQQATSTQGDSGVVGQASIDQATNSTANRKRLPLSGNADRQ